MFVDKHAKVRRVTKKGNRLVFVDYPKYLQAGKKKVRLRIIRPDRYIHRVQGIPSGSRAGGLGERASVPVHTVCSTHGVYELTSGCETLMRIQLTGGECLTQPLS